VEILRQQFRGDNGPALAISPDGSTFAVVSGANFRQVYLWKWQAGEEPRELVAGNHRASHLVFSPDSKVLGTCGDFSITADLWDVSTGRLLRSLTNPGVQFYATDMAFSPDGKLVVIPDAGHRRDNPGSGVHIWNRSSGKHLRVLSMPGQPAGSVALSPDSGQ